MSMGSVFGIGMWVYIMDINTTATATPHTLWCKQKPNTTDPGISLCLRFDQYKFYFTVKDGSVGLTQSAALFINTSLQDVPISDMVP